MPQYWWGNIYEAAKSAYLRCPLVQSITQGNLFTLPLDILTCQMDLLTCQMDLGLATRLRTASPSHGYKYILVMICTVSHWTEAFPCGQGNAPAVAKVHREGKQKHRHTPSFKKRIVGIY